MQIPLIKGDKVDSRADYGDSLPVNRVTVPHPIKGDAYYSYQWEGLTQFAEGVGADRGARWVTRTGLAGQYRISGEKFGKVEPSGTFTELGDVTGIDQGRIAFSFNNIAIAAGGNLYYYNPNDGFREITASIFDTVIDVVWADGFFIVTDGENVYHSQAADEEVFVDQGVAQFRPDVTFGLGINEDNELLAFGQNTTEYFVNRGLPDEFTYIRIDQKQVKVGICGTHCKIEDDARWYVLGRTETSSPGCYIIQSGGYEKISSREIDKLIDQNSEEALKSVTMDAVTKDAVTYIVYHLPNATVVYNATLALKLGPPGAWSILKSDVTGDTPYRARNFVRTPDSSRWICGDKVDGRIGQLDPEHSTQYGELAEWLMYSPLVQLDGLSIDKVELETIPGFAPDGDATVFYSRTDNGLWYSNEYIMQYGANQDYFQRFLVRRDGYVRDFTGWKFRGVSRSRMNFCYMTVEAS
jgi:hypothetical protein